MATAVPAARPRALALGRAAAVLGLGSAAVHLLLVDASSLGSLAMVGMALACLPCAWHLWRYPTPRVWAMTAACDAAMALLHGQMLSTAGTGGTAMAGMPGMDHGGPALGLMWVALGLVGTQLALAGIAALRR